MKKILLAVLFLVFIFVRPSFAATHDFLIDANNSYTVNDSGTTTVVQNFTLKNTTDYMYTPTYTLNTGLSSLSGVKVTSTDTKKTIPFEVLSNTNGVKSIQISFNNRVTGKTKTNPFTVSYSTDSIAKHAGTRWQISIPGIKNTGEFEQYTISLTAPVSFGALSIVKPYKTASNDGTNYHISYGTSELNASGVYAEFGNHQSYSFHLKYHIANPNFFPINSEMALPPSTNYQDIVIGSMNPKPSTIRIDEDGNWIAIYKLNTGQKLTVTVDGVATVFPSPKPETLTADERKKLTQSQKYWETYSSDIKSLAAKLKTPQKIYEYVRDTLTYDYKKVGKNNNRLGAENVLSHPTEAVCLEFTDLFVAIARAAGIPARGIEGYGYTDNPTLKPISEVNDILHTWPEYYDSTKKTWIMVDPTWGNTSLGSDYFHTIDFEHIVFVKHGLDSTYPIPAGGYKYSQNSKDIDVNVIENASITPSVHGQLVDTLPAYALFGLPTYGTLLVENTGNSVLRNVSVYVTSEIDRSPRNYSLAAVAPFGSENVPINLGAAPFLTNRDYTITIVSGVSQIKHTIHIGFVPQNDILILGGTIIVGIAGLYIAARKARSLLIQKR